MTKSCLALFAAAAIACGGSDKPVRGPASDQSPERVAPQPAGVLTVAPFTLTITGTRNDGTAQVRIFRGSADGVITVEAEGETREVVRVSADGLFTPLDPTRRDVARLGADGTFTLNGKLLPGRVDDDGTVYRGQEALLKIEGGKVIGLVDGIMSSKVTSNGALISETRFEMTVEGGDEVRRIVGAILLLQMTGGRSQDAPATEKKTDVPAAPTAP